MAYVPVPKDLTRVKSKFLFNLTKRQVVCFGLGARRRGLARRFRLSRSSGLGRSRGFHWGGSGIRCRASAADEQQSTDQTKSGQ